MVFGASYTDIAVGLPLLNILMIISIVIGILFLLNAKMGKWKLIRDGIIIFIVIVILGTAAGGITQALVVAPDEYNFEKPYIERNIKFSLLGYGLGSVKEKVFPVEYNLTLKEIERNRETVRNIRLWDWRPLKATYTQLQLFRTYYEFNDVDIDRYEMEDGLREVMVSAREMDISNLPVSAKTWVNEHMVYTHGYGVVMNPVDKVKDGLPEFLIKDIPPKSEYFSIERPQIYYGERTDTYAIVRTNMQEFDYPSGDQNVYTRYEGSGGVALNNLLKRLVYAFKFGSVEMLFSGSITNDSRLLMKRNIMEGD